MTDDETIQKLLDLKLTTMAQAYRDLIAEPPGNQRSFTEKIAVMVDREWTERDNRRLARLLRAAHLTITDACLENVWCEPGRGLDKAVARELATCQWIRKKHNVIVVGKTGVGKSYLGAALAQAACRNGLRAMCTRVPRLAHELAIARADGTYTVMLARLAKLDVLVLDDFLIAPLKDTERRDLLEVLEDRYGTLVDRRDLAGADQKLARDAGRPYHRRRNLRPTGPQRPRRRAQGPFRPRKERTPDRVVSTHSVSLTRRSAPKPRCPSLRSDGARVNRNERPDHAGTSARIDRNTHRES